MVRLSLTMSAVSHAWLVLVLSRATALPEDIGPWRTMPLWQSMLLGTVVAIGMSLFGTLVNDLLDARHDRMFRPHRSMATRRIGRQWAVGGAVGGLLAAIGASMPFGTASTSLCILCAAMVLVYNAAGRFVPGIGLVLLGLIRAIYMLIFNPQLALFWPVWLTTTHVIGVGAAAYVFEGKRPRLWGLQLWGVVAGWAFWSLAMIGWMSQRSHPTIPAWPVVLAVVGFAASMPWQLGRVSGEREAGRLLTRAGLMWLMVYDIAWLAGAQLWWAIWMPILLLMISWIGHRIEQRSSGPDELTTMYRREAQPLTESGR
jgi:hypothetical protein